MSTDSLLQQSDAPEAALASLRSRALIRVARVEAPQPTFDGPTIALHWASALLVLLMFASAWLHVLAAARASDFAPALLQLHRSTGLTVWGFTALRLAWRLTNASLPPFPAQMTTLHRAMVKLNEYGLYALLLAQPATGLLTTLAGGRPFGLFWWRISPLMPRDDMLRTAFHLAHELGAWTLAALIAGHAAAALFHHVVLRDDVLARMAPAIRRLVSSGSARARASLGPQVDARNKTDPLSV